MSDPLVFDSDYIAHFDGERTTSVSVRGRPVSILQIETSIGSFPVAEHLGDGKYVAYWDGSTYNIRPADKPQLSPAALVVRCEE
jgi:hypothetical protein